MENKKSGVFLGIVAVATLVVAIIGATFAYFSASASSNSNAVDITAYEFDVTIEEIEKVAPTETTSGIIPLNAGTNSATLLYAVNTGGSGSNICIDDNGYEVCQLYHVTLKNGTATATTLNVRINTKSNTAGTATGAQPFSDLTAQALSYETKYSALGAAITLEEEANSGVAFGDNVTATVPAAVAGTAGTGDFYFVVYLNETDDEDDQSEQMGAHYVGEIEFITGGNRLTGTFDMS